MREALAVSQRAIDATRASSDLNRRFAEDARQLAITALRLGEVADLEPILEDAVRYASQFDSQALTTGLHRVRGCVQAANGLLSHAQRSFDTALELALGMNNDVFIAEVHADKQLRDLHTVSSGSLRDLRSGGHWLYWIETDVQGVARLASRDAVGGEYGSAVVAEGQPNPGDGA